METMMPTQKELDVLIAQTSARYSRHFKPGLDPVSIVLKGHLFTEELLQDIICLHCRDTAPLEGIQIAYSHKAKLANALFGAHIPNFHLPDTIWPALDALNKLRNEFAHQLDSAKAPARLLTFLLVAGGLSKAPPKLTLTELESWPEAKLADQLTAAMMGVLGYLGALRAIAFLNTPQRLNS
jgi:hypothetical protein